MKLKVGDWGFWRLKGKCSCLGQVSSADAGIVHITGLRDDTYIFERWSTTRAHTTKYTYFGDVWYGCDNCFEPTTKDVIKLFFALRGVVVSKVFFSKPEYDFFLH